MKYKTCPQCGRVYHGAIVCGDCRTEDGHYVKTRPATEEETKLYKEQHEGAEGAGILGAIIEGIFDLLSSL